MKWNGLRRAAFALPLFAATPALAQEPPEETQEEDRNALTIGLGGAYMPSYEGSDDYSFTPIGVVFGKIAGFSFATRGTALTVNLIPEKADSPVSFEFGPLANVRLDRTGGIEDPQVRALGELDTAIELGAFAGIKKNGLLHEFDTLGFRVSWQKDVTDTHDSTIITPAIEYSTPLSTRTYLQLGAQMERVGDGYAQTYFSIGPAGSLASGLPVYSADGGWKNTRFTLLVAQALTGDLRNPGLSMFAGASYSKLRGDFKESPIVSIAGDADQYLALAGLSYSF